MKKFLFPILIIFIVGILFSFSVQEAVAVEGVWESCEEGTRKCRISGYDNNMGYKFTPTQNGQVTHLCGYFMLEKWVGLYDSSLSSLAGTWVTGQSNSWKWACVSITPVDIIAGSVYYVGAEMDGTEACYRSGVSLPKTCNTVTIHCGVEFTGSTVWEEPTIIRGMADIVFSSGGVVTTPTVITEEATISSTQLQNNQATLKGNVTNNGGENPSQRTLEWGTSSGSYPNSYNCGSGGTGEFSYTILINPGTIYYYRAKAYNSEGWGYGAEKQVVIYEASGDQQQFTTPATEEPTIAFSPTSFSFSVIEGGSNPFSKTLKIWNSGSGTLNWSVSDNATWLSLSPISGSSTGEDDNVTVSVNNISGMTAGIYNATITITDPNATNSPQIVPVILNITAGVEVCPRSSAISCSSPNGYGSIPCGGTKSDCVYGEDLKYYKVPGSAGKVVTVTLTYSGDSCEYNDLAIYDLNCNFIDDVNNLNWTKTWTGTPSTDIIIEIDGDTLGSYLNENCLWDLSVECAEAPTPSGYLDCYYCTENSITLYYQFSNGSNVSLFRGSTKLTTFSGSSGSGTYPDPNTLSPGTSYTYYLRNGTSTSSTELAKKICSTTTPTFDFSLRVNPSSDEVVQGDLTSATVWADLLSGDSQFISFSTSISPSEPTISIDPIDGCIPGCHSAMTIFTSTTTPVRTYTITVTGTGGGLTRYAYYQLTVTAPVCGGSVLLTLTPSTVAPSGSVVPSASGLSSGCNGKTVYFRQNSCSGTFVRSCAVSSGGCSGSTFTAPATPAVYTYYACIDKNNDGDYSDSGEYNSKTLNVTTVTCTPAGACSNSGEYCCANNKLYICHQSSKTDTFYSTPSDGHLITTSGYGYEYVHHIYSGTPQTTSASIAIGQGGNSTWELNRAGLFFNTSGLPDDANITATTLSLYGAQDNSTRDFYITVVSGADLNDPLVPEDFYPDLYNATESRGRINTSGFTTSGYNNITLNSIGLNEISRTGITKFGLRSSRDIDYQEPSSQEIIRVYANEKGSGYQPKLSVTYITPLVWEYVEDCSYGCCDVNNNSCDPCLPPSNCKCCPLICECSSNNIGGCCDGCHFCPAGTVFNGSSCSAVSCTNYCGTAGNICTGDKNQYQDRQACGGTGFCNGSVISCFLQDCGATSNTCWSKCRKDYTYTCSGGSCGTYHTYTTASQGYRCDAGNLINTGSCTQSSWNACVNTGGSPYQCKRKYDIYRCNGTGYNDTDCNSDVGDVEGNIASGYVCTGSGTQTTGSNTYYSSLSGYNTRSADKCDKKRDKLACNGSGGIAGPDVGDDWTYVSAYKIANSSSQEVDASSSDNTGTCHECTDGTCSGTYYWGECDGVGNAGPCSTYNQSETVYALAGYSLTSSCWTNGSTLCDSTWRASAGFGDNYYGKGGDLNCQGMCDGLGACEYAVNCDLTDNTPPIVEIIDESPNPKEGWLKAGTYKVKVHDEDPESGIKESSCRYYLTACDSGGVNCEVKFDRPRTCNGWIDEITLGKNLSNDVCKEGSGTGFIVVYAENNVNLTGEDSNGFNTDFTPPETWIE